LLRLFSISLSLRDLHKDLVYPPASIIPMAIAQFMRPPIGSISHRLLCAEHYCVPGPFAGAPSFIKDTDSEKFL